MRNSQILEEKLSALACARQDLACFFDFISQCRDLEPDFAITFINVYKLQNFEVAGKIDSQNST